MPRNFKFRTGSSDSRTACFNEAAADAAEFSEAAEFLEPEPAGFNEAAADAAEFSNIGARLVKVRLRFNEAAADAAEF